MNDLTKLQRLLGGDSKKVARFITIFKNEIPRQLQQLSDDMASGQYEELGIVAHSIKSQVNYLGRNDIAILAKDLETSAENNDPARVQECYDKLKRALDMMLSEAPFI